MDFFSNANMFQSSLTLLVINTLFSHYTFVWLVKEMAWRKWQRNNFTFLIYTWTMIYENWFSVYLTAATYDCPEVFRKSCFLSSTIRISGDKIEEYSFPGDLYTHQLFHIFLCIFLPSEVNLHTWNGQLKGTFTPCQMHSPFQSKPY